MQFSTGCCRNNTWPRTARESIGNAKSCPRLPLSIFWQIPVVTKKSRSRLASERTGADGAERPRDRVLTITPAIKVKLWTGTPPREHTLESRAVLPTIRSRFWCATGDSALALRARSGTNVRSAPAELTRDGCGSRKAKGWRRGSPPFQVLTTIVSSKISLQDRRSAALFIWTLPRSSGTFAVNWTYTKTSAHHGGGTTMAESDRTAQEVAELRARPRRPTG